VLVANYKLQDLGAYGLADASTTGIAYLGASTSGSPSSTNAPTWVADVTFLFFDAGSHNDRVQC